MPEQLTVIPVIMAEAETVVESGPTLQEAFHAGPAPEREAEPEIDRPKRNTKLSEETDTQRQLDEMRTADERAKPKREQSLAEAYEGVEPEPAESFTLPAGFEQFSADDIAAVCGLLGLEEGDLKEPRFAAMALKELEASFASTEDEEEDDPDPELEENEDDEESKEKNEEDQKEAEAAARAEAAAKAEAERKAANRPLPQTIAELTADQRIEMGQHIEQVWERAQKINSSVYTENFVASLGNILETPPEQMPRLRETVEALQWGAQNIVETAVPVVVTNYLQEHIIPILRQCLPHVFGETMEQFAPGFSADYSERTLTSVWDSVRGSDLPEFSMEADSEFQKLAQALPPQLLSWEPKAADGKSLPIRAALKAKAEIVSKLMRGERASPKALQEAVTNAMEIGRRGAEKSNRRVSASRALGKGRTTGSIGKQERGETSLRDAYSAVHDREGGI
jgi:hypothetical protein